MRTYVLGIENFMKIERATIPLRGVIGLVGKNAQGKTSVLKAIQDVLTGQNDCTKIRDGADKAVISITASDENTGEELFSISRSQTETGSKLQGKGLKPGQTPAGILGVLFDEVAINPIRLLENGPVEYLKKHLQAPFDLPMMPADLCTAYLNDPAWEGVRGGNGDDGFAFVEANAKHIETERKVAARDLKQHEAMIENARKGLPEEMPAAPYDQAPLHAEETELRSQKENARVINSQAAERRTAVTTRDRELAECKQKRGALMEKKIALEAQLKELEPSIAAAQMNVESAESRVKVAIAYAQEITPVDLEATDHALVALGQKISALKNHQVIVDKFTQLKEMNQKLREMKEAHELQDKLYKYFRYEAPKQLIEKCKLPVEGIEFREGEMFVNDRHISKMSTAERAIVATKLAIMIAKQKGHIAVCLDGVENLDEEHMGEFIKAAEDSEIAVIYTRAGEAPQFKCERLVEGGVIQ